MQNLQKKMVIKPSQQRVELSMEEWCNQQKNRILSHVSEYDIVRAFWPGGKELHLDRGIGSPFRKDNTPSFIIGTKYGCITYKDMGDYNFRGDVWKFVQQIEQLQGFGQVIQRIDQMFNIGHGGNPIEGKKLITWTQPKIEVKPPPLIQVAARKFTKTELQWWNLRHQDISDLKREHIYAPKEIWRNRQRIQLMDMTFCYWFPEIEKWKLYRPLAPKREKNTPSWMWKWDSTVPFNYIENLDAMKGDIGILEKARKDRMVVRKATGIEAICNGQAEDPSVLTDEDMYHIWSHCRTKIVVSDSDKKGKEFSWWLTQEHGYIHCNTPDDMLPEINDFDGMAVKYGLDSVTRHFRNKGII